MELNAVYKSFFALLRAGLWNREPECECFPISSEAWRQVYVLARKQTVEGIVYDGITLLPDRYFPPKDLLLKWVVAIDSMEKINGRMNRVVGDLNELFSKHHITALVLKGQGVAACYANPLHRVCGDIDLFFPDKDHFDRANRLITDSGIKVDRKAGFSVEYYWKNFLIEHHRHIVDISNPFMYRYINRLQQQEYSFAVNMVVNDSPIRLPSPIMTHLTVNTHILKHLLSFGISIRQLCDSARICYTWHRQIDAEQMKKIYRRLGIYRWMQLLNTLLVNYLGMSEEYLPFPLEPQRKADMMMRDMLQSGNFGFYGSPFAKETDNPQVKRKHVWLHLSIRFFRYVRYAPLEACWFPVMHTYSHFIKWFER